MEDKSTGNGRFNFAAGVIVSVVDASGSVRSVETMGTSAGMASDAVVRGERFLDVLLRSGVHQEACLRLSERLNEEAAFRVHLPLLGAAVGVELCAAPWAATSREGRVLVMVPQGLPAPAETRLYMRALEGTSDAVWEMDLEGYSSQWGPGLRKLLRVPDHVEDVGVPAWLERVPAEAAQRLMELGEAYKQGAIEHHSEEYPIRCYDGMVRWVLDRGCVLERNAAGGASKVVGVVTDIDRLKHAEEGLARTEHRLAEVFKAFGAAVMLEDERHRVLLVNDAFCAFTGFARHELEGATTYRILASERAVSQFSDPEQFFQRVASIVQEGEPVQAYQLVLKDGRSFEIDYTPIWYGGAMGGHLWVCRDVTDRERLQRELLASQRQLSAVMDHIGVGLVMDEDNRIRLANDTLYRIFGSPLQGAALVGVDMNQAILDNAFLFRDPEVFVESSMRCRAGNQPVDGELLTLADGRIVERDFMPLDLPGGSRGNLFTYRDVTERYRLVEELRISGELLSMVFGSIDEALLLEDENRCVRLTNDAFCTMFGIEGGPALLVGMDCSEASRKVAGLMRDPQGFLDGIGSALAVEGSTPPAELELNDGRVLEWSHTMVRLTHTQEGHLWSYRDVTERHRLEREKREMRERNERLLSAVAQATAGLVRGGPVLEAMRDGLSAVGRATQVDRVYLFQNRYDNQGRVRSTSQRFEWNSDSAEPQVDNPDLWDTPVEVFADILPLMEKGLSWAAHVKDMEEGGLRDVLEPQGILSILILPIMVQGRFWGFMGFDQCTHLREWSANERSILHSLCASVSSALERERLLEQRAKDLAAERTANRFNQRIMGLTDEQAVYEVMVEEMTFDKEVAEVSIHTVDPVTGSLRPVATSATPGQAHVWDTRFPGRTLVDEVLRSRTPRWSYDLRDEQVLIGFQLMPIACDDEVAAIVACRMEKLGPWPDDLVGLPGKLADLAAMKLLQLRTHRAATEKDARYRRVIANMQLGLVEVDSDQRITYVNDTLCTMSGYTVGELMGRQLFEIEGLHAAMDTFTRQRNMRSQGISDAFEVGVTLRDGEQRHWFISGAPQFNAEGHYIGSVSVVLDISERLRMEQDLLAANRKAGEALQAKELFLANMSHEMRTPMNAIVGLCNEMLRETSDPVQHARLSAVIMAGNNLMKLMNDLLDASRAAVGMLSLDLVPMDVAACLRQVETVMRPLAIQKGLLMRASISPQLAPWLLGDPRRLDQVLMNLVGNALKFTPRGSVDLELQVLGQDANGQKLRFTVRDTGVGIDPAFMPNLFEPFNRDPAQQDMAVEGAGLGLSITKELLDLMKGSITAHSALGKGTSMVVELELPFAQPRSKPAAPKAASPAAAPPPGTRILLVEDSAFNRMVVRSMVGGLDLVLDEAEHGVEALVRMATHNYDILLLDLRMPVMDGYDFLAALRGPLRSGVPVLALTAGDDAQSDLLQAGMTAVLRKPLERDALLEALAQAVSAVDAPSCWRHDRGPDGPCCDTAMVRNMVAGDDALFSNVVQAFLKEVPGNIAALTDALERADLHKLADAAHRMKPSVIMFGMARVQGAVDMLVALKTSPQPLARVAVAVTLVLRELHMVEKQLSSTEP